MKFLSVNDLIQDKNKRVERRKECFDKVLDQCCSKIKKAAKLDKTFCLYDVPEFILGYPLYNINECMTYVIDKLAKNGFAVQYFFPRYIVVSWFITPPPVATAVTNAQRLLPQHFQHFQQQTLSQPRQVVNPTYMQMQNALPIGLPKQELVPKAQDNEDDFDELNNLLVSPKGRQQRKKVQAKPRSQSSQFVKSIAEYKPSGKFVLDLS